MYGWNTEGECEANTNLINIRASIFKFDVADLSCQRGEMMMKAIKADRGIIRVQSQTYQDNLKKEASRFTYT